MKDCLQKVEDFLSVSNARVSLSFNGRIANSDWNESTPRNSYYVTISTPKGSMGVTFWDSVYNTNNNELPTVYDILSCLTKYDCGTFSCFCNQFGYNNDSTSALKTYLACVKEYHDIRRIFTDEQLEALRNID